MGPFVVAFLVLAGLVTVAFTAVLDAEKSFQLAELEAAERTRTSLAANAMEASIDAATSDGRVATSSRAVSSLARGITPESLASAGSVFRAQVSNKPSILQLRYVDESGNERLLVRRTGYGIERAPESALRNVASHHSFADTRQLEPGHAYVTRLDLEVDEAGAIVEPRQPLMRIFTALGNDSGERVGSVVVDLDGEHLLRQVEEIVGVDQLLLLDAGGGIITGPGGADSFSFVTGGDSFADRHPDAWSAIAANEVGNVTTVDGLYTFTTAHPDHAEVRLTGAAHDPHTHEHPNALKVVSFVPAEALPSAAITRDIPTLLTYVGTLIALAAVTGFITNARVAKRQFRRSIRDAKNRLEAIRDTLGEGLVVTDIDGRITDVNPECERMLGWTREQMLGRSAAEVFHHTPAPEQCSLIAVARTGETFRSDDETFQRRDGSEIQVGVSAAPLVTEDGIEGAVMVFRDITEIRQYQEEIRQLAFRDELTGLPNRRVLSDRLELAIAAADRRSVQLAVLFLDLDGFKEVNDEHGHAIGDAFLREVAARLKLCLRANETLARYGGDEFVVLLPELDDPDEAELVARRIIDGLQAPFLIEGLELRAGVSVGIAMRRAGECGDELIARADDAMYEAKEAGRNLYRIADTAPVVG